MYSTPAPIYQECLGLVNDAGQSISSNCDTTLCVIKRYG